MSSSANVPVVFTAEEEAVLNEGIGLILSRWTAMRAAVDFGWGGRDSQEKAERTVSKVFDHFTKSRDPMDFDGLADKLEDGLKQLSTVADDESVEEVTEKLLDLYEECLEGNYQTVERLRVTIPQMSASVVKVSNGNDDDESDDDDEDDEDTCMDNDQSTDMMMDESDNGKGNSEALPDDDGWLLFRKEEAGETNNFLCVFSINGNAI